MVVVDIKQTEAFHCTSTAVDAIGVGNAFCRPASDSRRRRPSTWPPRRDMGLRHVDIPALGAQESEIADGGFAAGQDHDDCVAWNGLAGPHEDELHPGLHAQRIEVVEIGDARPHRHGDDARG